MTPARRRALRAITVVAGVLLAAPVVAQSAPPMITVSGEATLSVAPDLAEVEAGVTSDGKTRAEASEANNVTMGKVLLALKAAGIDARDIQNIAAFAATAERADRSTNAIVGYRASNQVTVRLRDVTKVASTIDMLVGAGANDVGGINFMVSQASKLLDDAANRRWPTRAARPRSTPGRRRHVGRAAQYSEEGSPGPVFRAKMAGGMAAAAPVAQGEETLQITVNVSWAIQAAGP